MGNQSGKNASEKAYRQPAFERLVALPYPQTQASSTTTTTTTTTVVTDQYIHYYNTRRSTTLGAPDAKRLGIATTHDEASQDAKISPAQLQPSGYFVQTDGKTKAPFMYARKEGDEKNVFYVAPRKHGQPHPRAQVA
eukprot:ANDGO_05513.mRNA.1 hypothetical protein